MPPINVTVSNKKGNNCKKVTLVTKQGPIKTVVSYSHTSNRLFKNTTPQHKGNNKPKPMNKYPQPTAQKPIGVAPQHIITECEQKIAHKPIIIEQPKVIEQTQPTEQPQQTTAQTQPIVQAEQIIEQLKDTTKYPMVMNTIDDALEAHIINGCSVRGTSHIKDNTPGQDYCDYKTIGKGWGIAVVSDGAGSYKLSHKGSKSNCIQAIRILEAIIKNKKWMENNYMPTELEWYIVAINTFNKIYQFATHYANSNGIKPSELSATIIVNIITPQGILAAHIGDGRCGYLNGKGEWKPTMIPHKGEEANQTVFLHTNMHKNAGAELNGILVPETRVIIDEVQAFTLMSDGCEKSTWECSVMKDEMWEDPNKPYAPFFNNIINILKNDDEPINALTSIVKTSKIFSKETDDKTIVIGYKL